MYDSDGKMSQNGTGYLNAGQIAKGTAASGYENGTWSPEVPTDKVAITADTEFVITYVPQSRTVTVNYVDEEGNKLQNAYVTNTKYDAPYDVTNNIPAELDAGEHHYVRFSDSGNLSGTVKDNIVVTVVYTIDDKGNGNKPDGTPDKFQLTVTYTVQNGAWNTGSKDSIEHVLTLKDSSGNFSETGWAIDENQPEAGEQPNIGYDKTGAWKNPGIPERFEKVKHDGATYTYEYPIHFYKLTVNHVYRPADEKAQVEEHSTEDTRVYGAELNCAPIAASTFGIAGNFVYAGVKTTDLTAANIQNHLITGTMPAKDVTITFYYDEDNAGTDPKNPDKPGDGKPDRYQIIFRYFRNGDGELDGVESEVADRYDKIEMGPDGNWQLGKEGAKPVNPPTPKAFSGSYFMQWQEGKNTFTNADLTEIEMEYKDNTDFTAVFVPNPNNTWEAGKELKNLPARGYFRVGEVAQFEIRVWLTEKANRAITDITVKEIPGAYFVEYDNCGYKVNGNVATIESLEKGKTVILRAEYKITRNDLFNRRFDNTVEVSGKNSTTDTTPNEPGRNEVQTLKRGVYDIPAGAQGGSGGSGGGGGGGSSTRSPGTGGGTAGGPGTVTIDPEAVPLANLPDMGNDDILALIDDEEVPLAALPKTGQTGSAALMLMISSMMLAAFAAVTRKKEEEQ